MTTGDPTCRFCGCYLNRCVCKNYPPPFFFTGDSIRLPSIPQYPYHVKQFVAASPLEQEVRELVENMNDASTAYCPCDGPLSTVSVNRKFHLLHKFAREAEGAHIKNHWVGNDVATPELRDRLLKTIAVATALLEGLPK